MNRIIYLFLDIFIGTALVYDCFTHKIPNYVIAAGVCGLLPIMYAERGGTGVGLCITNMIIFTLMLFVVYMLHGLGAGDVKLLGVLCGGLGLRDAFVYIILVLILGAAIGGAKLVYIRISKQPFSKITPVLFTIPATIAYIIYLISKGV